MKFKVGELIRWTSEFDDYIVKDGGIGIIVGSSEYSYKDIKHTTYVVYRNETRDEIPLSDRNIFKLIKKEK
jgi:DNA-directed RNA polymerase specialized sigma54-like protein